MYDGEKWKNSRPINLFEGYMQTYKSFMLKNPYMYYETRCENIKANDRQKEILQNNHQFRCFVAYHGSGLTYGMLLDMSIRAIVKDGANILWITHPVKIYRNVELFCKFCDIVGVKAVKRVINGINTVELENGSNIVFCYPLNIENDISLLKSKKDEVYIDDASSLDGGEDLFNVCSLRPCKTDSNITIGATLYTRLPEAVWGGDSVLALAACNISFDLQIFQNLTEEVEFAERDF